MCVLCSSLTWSGEEGMGGEVWMQFGKGGGDAKGVVAWVSGRSRVGGRLRKRGGVMCVSEAETAGAIWCGYVSF